MVYLDVVIIALIVVLLLILVPHIDLGHKPSSKKEGFDTYYNHDLGAYNAYASGFGDQMGFKPKSVGDANLYARYAWSEKNPAGMDVYDQYYETYIRTNGSNDADTEYAYRVVDNLDKDSAYDEKFAIRDGENRFYGFHIGDMVDRNPARVYDFHSDEDAALAQKNY